MNLPLMQPHEGPVRGDHYLPSRVETVTWGWLPAEGTTPALHMRSGETITVDTVSHEGIVEDHGRDPLNFFGRFGVATGDVLCDAIDIAANYPIRQTNAGPHVVTGPVSVAGAKPGDALKIDFLELVPRAYYGIISNRHGYGALPGELPPLPRPDFVPDPSDPEQSGTVSLFCTVSDYLTGVLPTGTGRDVRFPLAPFLGLVGVTPAGEDLVKSVPPGPYGGNLDIKDLVAGTSLYLPVQVDGAGLFAGDPHYAQGHGEVALTALEAPLRATLRVTVLPAAECREWLGILDRPFGETREHWLAVGLHRDLNEAFKSAVREALRVLMDLYQVPTDVGYAYLSAAGDFVVSQVVDDVKGVHCLIRKSDFSAWT